MPEQEVSGDDPQEHPAEAEADPQPEPQREPEPLRVAPGCPCHSKYFLGTSIRTHPQQQHAFRVEVCVSENRPVRLSGESWYASRPARFPRCRQRPARRPGYPFPR